MIMPQVRWQHDQGCSWRSSVLTDDDMVQVGADAVVNAFLTMQFCLVFAGQNVDAFFANSQAPRSRAVNLRMKNRPPPPAGWPQVAMASEPGNAG